MSDCFLRKTVSDYNIYLKGYKFRGHNSIYPT